MSNSKKKLSALKDEEGLTADVETIDAVSSPDGNNSGDDGNEMTMTASNPSSASAGTPRRITLDHIIDTVTRASAGSIKILESVLPLLKMIVTVTYDVSETLKAHGIEVEQESIEQAATNLVHVARGVTPITTTSQALTTLAIYNRALGLLYEENHKG